MSNTRKAATAPPASRSIAEIRELAKPRESSVTLCVDGSLLADAERLTSALKKLAPTGPGASLADGGPRAALEQELSQVRERMVAAEVTFRFRALPPREYSDLFTAHPARDGENEGWNTDTFPQALMAGCGIDPVMTVDDAQALWDIFNEDGRAQLFNAAWRANNAPSVIPS